MKKFKVVWKTSVARNYSDDVGQEKRAIYRLISNVL
jgi:hypothetical protein